MVTEVCNTVKLNGYIAGVLPSGDTIDHLIGLSREKLIDSGVNKENAVKLTNEYYIEQHKFDPIKGVYADDEKGEHLQKMYWPEEIKELLEMMGFENIKLEKVYYPWAACRAFGWGYYPKSEKVWDWAFIAQKKKLL